MIEIEKGHDKFFVGEQEDHPQAEITFRQVGHVLVVEHTYVDDTLRGEGIAGKLVAKVVDYARENDWHVQSECSYASWKLEQTPAYHDVWQDG